MRVLKYDVTDCDDGRQIKQVIRTHLGISHRQLSRLKNTDGMSVNDTSVHANFVVHTGDAITLRLEEETAKPSEEQGSIPSECDIPTAAGNIDCDELDKRYREDIQYLSPSGNATTQSELAREIIIYEDEDMLIINKPAPLPTGASARQKGLTLESVLYARYGKDGDFQFRPVNRLDKGTSGLMAVALTAHAHYGLQRQLHTPDFEREYLALTVGAPKPGQGIVDLPIGREPDSIVKRRIDPQGRPCRTHYAVLGEQNGIALVRLKLETGRTHQIRVHMAALGCPVFGDFLYGSENERLSGRFALHSWHLKCVQPVTGEHMEFYADMPAKMAALSPKVDKIVH